MVNHGLSTGALFALLAFLLDRYRTTQIAQFGGLMGRFPKLRGAGVRALAREHRPAGAEQLRQRDADARRAVRRRQSRAFIIWGSRSSRPFGILLSAWYILTMLQKVFFNPHEGAGAGWP